MNKLTIMIQYEPEKWEVVRIALAEFLRATKEIRTSAMVSSPELITAKRMEVA